MQHLVAIYATRLSMEQQVYYISKLKECLSIKQKENSSYSLRAFSRDLDIHCATLSQVIQGKRNLPIKRANDVVDKLELSPKEKTLFLESFFRSKTSIDDIKIEKLDKRFILDESYYKVIAEWEHYAVLELFNLAYFDLSVIGVSKKLGIDKNRSEVVLNNLIECGLLIQAESGDLERAFPDIKTTEDISSSALKKSHRETLKMGINKLEEIEVEYRDFSSTTVAVALEKLPEAKTIIREFRQKMTSLLRDGNKTEIYQLAIQFFPLTNLESKEK